MTNWDQVGGEPAPGNVGAIREQARQLVLVSERGRDVESRLRELHQGMGQLRWQGAGASGVSDLVSDTLPGLVTFWSEHAAAGRALGHFADSLDALQTQAHSALDQFTGATATAQSAAASSADADNRHDAAQRSVSWLDLEIDGAEGRRLVAMAAHQTTTALDSELADLRHQRAYQASLRDAASNDRSVASARRNAAEAQLAQARKVIEQIRHEATDDSAAAAAAISAAVGVVHSLNPLVRLWDDAVHDANAGLKWFSDNALDEWDEALGRLSLLALVIAPIPVLDFLDAPLAAVIGAMGAVSAVGHLYRAANGQESLFHASISVLEIIPVGGALGRLAHTDAKAFENLPGIAKRLRWFDNASHAKGIYSSKGVQLLGKVVYRVHVVPKPIGPVVLTRSLLVAKATQIVARQLDKGNEDLQKVEHAIGLRHDDDPPPSHEQRAEQVITVLLKHGLPRPKASQDQGLS